MFLTVYNWSGKKFILRVDCPFSILYINSNFLSPTEDQTGRLAGVGCRAGFQAVGGISRLFRLERSILCWVLSLFTLKRPRFRMCTRWRWICRHCWSAEHVLCPPAPLARYTFSRTSSGFEMHQGCTVHVWARWHGRGREGRRDSDVVACTRLHVHPHEGPVPPVITPHADAGALDLEYSWSLCLCAAARCLELNISHENTGVCVHVCVFIFQVHLEYIFCA